MEIAIGVDYMSLEFGRGEGLSWRFRYCQSTAGIMANYVKR